MSKGTKSFLLRLVGGSGDRKGVTPLYSKFTGVLAPFLGGTARVQTGL
ncbi:MAG: hypothetical protein HWN66_19595 [Candidatus Helarchaeota archaeon]|nr:hypothetical protein [Candidatus Helarchaeota archaeon]